MTTPAFKKPKIDAAKPRCIHPGWPDGYIARSEWAEKKLKTHDQVKCEECGLFAIWVKK